MIKVLIFIDFFYPGYKGGGILRSVYNLVNRLEGIQFYIVSKNKDLGDEDSYKEIESNSWIKRDEYTVMYLSSSAENPLNIYQIINKIKPNYIHINCIYRLTYGLIPLVFCKYIFKQVEVIVSANGMLSLNALMLKQKKKKVFLFLVKKMQIFSKIKWHATNKKEKKEIIQCFGKSARIKVAPYIVSLKKINEPRNIKKANRLTLVFYSRITREKNLVFALECLKSIEFELTFRIIGPITDLGYFQDCSRLIKELPNNIHIELKGEIPFYNTQEELKKTDFLFLPTLTENYGHVIIESLNAGCPVLISDNTPWQSFNEKNIGWILPLNDKSKWEQVIKECFTMDSITYKRMSESAQSAAQEIVEDAATLEANKELYIN